MQERHSRDGYFIVGEGLVGSTAPRPTGAVIFALNDGDQRPFRFSRVGPEGAQLGEPNRLKIAIRMTRLGDGQVNGSIPSGYTYLGQFIDHDLTFDKSKLAGGISLSRRRARAVALAQPRPRLALRPGPRPEPRVLQAGQGAPEDRHHDPGAGPAGHEQGPSRLRPPAQAEREGADPGPAQRREPGRRPDPLRVHPLPQPGGQHAGGAGGAAGRPVLDRARGGGAPLPVDDPARLPAAHREPGHRQRRVHLRAQGGRDEPGAGRVAHHAGRVLGGRLPPRPQHGARRLRLEPHLRRRRRHARPPVHLLGNRRRPGRVQHPAQQLDRRLPAPLQVHRRRPRRPAAARGRRQQAERGPPHRHPPGEPARPPAPLVAAGRRDQPAPRQPGLPEPDPRADAAPRHGPADGRLHALAGRRRDHAHLRADPQRQPRREAGGRRRADRRPADGAHARHPAVVLHPPRGRAEQRAAARGGRPVGGRGRSTAPSRAA